MSNNSSRPQTFAVTRVIDLFHVYDDLSQTPYRPGVGLLCGDRAVSQAITPSALLRHADWGNRQPTEFISFFNNWNDAENEANRRFNNPFVPGGFQRRPESVRIAQVQLQPGTTTQAFSRTQMLDYVNSISSNAGWDMHSQSHPNEWYVWGDVPNHEVLTIY